MSFPFKFYDNCANEGLIQFILFFCAKISWMLGKSSKRLTLDDIKEKLSAFLLNFEDPEMDEEEI